MTYWHMQLHPDDKNWGREKELLEKKALIGIGDWEGGQSQINQFKNEIQIGDIVLIKRGAMSIALTKVIGNIEESEEGGIDWFKYRRKVEILDFYSKTIADFPYPRGTLKKSITKSSITYKYIDNWHKLINPDKLESLKGLKISRIEIEKFKMFKNFSISFQKDENILPIVVIAGSNGSGKTTLLQYIKEFTEKHIEINNKSSIKFNYFDNTTQEAKIETINQSILIDKETYLKSYFEQNIEYLPTDTHQKLNDVENAIKTHLKHLVWEDKYTVDEAYDEIKTNIQKIFNDGNLNFNINFFSLDKNEDIYFTNRVDCQTIECAFKLGEISTGQKTLLTKVLYLYLNDVRDKVVLIDEPELSLHPSWQSSIFKIYENFARENNCQVILATHSPHIIANTPHKYLRFLVEEEGKIVAKSLDGAPLDRDLNTIIKTVMGADYIPQWLEEKHFAYRELCENGEEDSEEAEKLKSEILEYESPNSSFFQGLAFDMELMR
jgi:AAA15 family ATPase/GTPase